VQGGGIEAESAINTDVDQNDRKMEEAEGVFFLTQT
jgi:hypothetical protein